jgi:alpha-L-fucosidase
LSPWDRHEKSYGDTEAYNTFYLSQLTELLTHYGRIDEVWFDGANGEGPNGRKQTYDWPAIWAHTLRLQPDAVIFSDAGPGVRWIGNEQGLAGDPNWSTVDPDAVPTPGTTGAAALRMLQHGDPHGRVWRPGETDVSIRPGWFYHEAEDARVRSVDNLVDLYFTSVGRNSKLLLNVPPTRAGRLHDTDVERLAGMRRALDARFAVNLASRRASWKTMSETVAMGVVDLGGAHAVSIIDLRERIEDGQRVATYAVDASMDKRFWTTIATGTTIGCRKLDRIAPAQARYLRVTIECLDDKSGAPTPVEIGAFA